jgi:hypothetical protein
MAVLSEVILLMKVKSNILEAPSGAFMTGIVTGILALSVAISSGALAAQDESDELRPPEVSSESGDGQAKGDGRKSRHIESPVIREREEYGQIITEYERRGGVYLMTVKPRVGPTQYWNDPDGDGQFQRSTSDDIDENLNLPKWRLGGW